jgi:hypothetical protein
MRALYQAQVAVKVYDLKRQRVTARAVDEKS